MLEDLVHKVEDYTGLAFLSKKSFLMFALMAVLGTVSYFWFKTRTTEKNVSATEIEKPTVLAATDTTKEPIKLFCDINGAVIRPGVYQLYENSRLTDAIKSAGGISSDSDFHWIASHINLAEKLTDGCKVYIPFAWDVVEPSDAPLVEKFSDSVIPMGVQNAATQSNLGSSTGYSNPSSSVSNPSNELSSKINVNKAAESQLIGLKGIGSAYAQKIIQNRPYKDLNDFVTKTKFSTNLINSLKEAITF